MNKVLITGTGRCGTSFLMQLLTNLGLNTGYTKEEAEEEIKRIDGLNAGIEHGLNDKRIEKAQIIKSPEFIKIESFTALSEKYTIEHVIIPIRNLENTAKSRELMDKNTHAGYGGYWLGAHNVEEQKTANAKALYNFIEYLSREDITFSLISFERMIENSTYLYNILMTCFWDDMPEREVFNKHYNELIRPDYVRF